MQKISKSFLENKSLNYFSILGKIDKIKIINNNKENEIDLNNRTIYINKIKDFLIIEIIEDIDNFKNLFKYENNISKLNDEHMIYIIKNLYDENIKTIYGLIRTKDK